MTLGRAFLLRGKIYSYPNLIHNVCGSHQYDTSKMAFTHISQQFTHLRNIY